MFISDARADPNPRDPRIDPRGGLSWVKIFDFFGGAGWGGSNNVQCAASVFQMLASHAS